MAHMLTLTSKRVDESAYVAASVARELYGAHMQRVAGPEAQIARESQP